MNTDQIVESFKGYIINEDRFAVLLSGSWGVGKTYFWDNYLQPVAEEKQLKIIKISVFGLSTREQIHTAIVNGVIEVGATGKKGLGFVAKAMEGYLNDLSDSKAASGLSSLVSSAATEYAFKSVGPTSVLVVDDLERSKLPAAEVLAVLNVLVESQGTKVLILADESKIEEDKYYSYKEKVIRYSWELKWEEEEYFSIISESAGPKVQSVLEHSGDQLKCLIEQTAHQNLRSWISGIKQLEAYYDKAWVHVSDDNRIQIQIMIYGLVIRVLCTYKPVIADAEIISWPEMPISYSEDKDLDNSALTDKQKERKEIRDKRKELYDMLQGVSITTPSSVFKHVNEFFTKGYCSEEDLINECQKWKDNQAKQWVRFCHTYPKLDSKTFDIEYSKVKKSLEAGEITDSKQFTQLALIDSELIRMNAISADKAAYLPLWEGYISEVLSEHGFDLLGHFDDIITLTNMSDYEPEFLELLEKIRQAVDQSEKVTVLDESRVFWDSLSLDSDFSGKLDFKGLHDTSMTLDPSFIPKITDLLDTTENKMLGNLLTRIYLASEYAKDHQMAKRTLKSLKKHVAAQKPASVIDKYWQSRKLSLLGERKSFHTKLIQTQAARDAAIAAHESRSE